MSDGRGVGGCRLSKFGQDERALKRRDISVARADCPLDL
jgi:hypothetical protein